MLKLEGIWTFTPCCYLKPLGKMKMSPLKLLKLRSQFWN